MMGISWINTSTSFTTLNPKLISYITSKATEAYTTDTAGGANLEFYTT